MSDLREQLLDIRAQHGQLTPSIVVEEARHKTSPLHRLVFDKAPKDAAETYYRQRAHELIRSCRIAYREATEDEAARSIRAFQAVRSEGPNEYVYEPSDEIANDPLLTAMVLRNMEREWKQLHRRYGAFAEFIELVRRALEDDAA